MPSGVWPSGTTSSELTTGASHGCFGDAVVRQHVGLPFGGRRAVTAHRPGIMNGFAPRDFQKSTIARAMASMLVMPRLPTPIAIRLPGLTARVHSAASIAWRTAAATSGKARFGKFCRIRTKRWSLILVPL